MFFASSHTNTLKTITISLTFLGLGFFLTGCSTPVKKTPAKELCSGTKRPYEIKGIRYTPQDHYDYEEHGIASWYGPGFDKKPGSCGTKFDMHSYTAAHKTLPIPSVVEVTNVDNGKSLHLVINDRGPFVGDRIIDLSKKAAIELGTHGKGLGKVRVKALPEQSVALANFLKQYGRYGMDPSGRGWDEIYRVEIADKYQQYQDPQPAIEPKISNAVYHPEEPKISEAVYHPNMDSEVEQTLAVLSPAPLPPKAQPAVYTKKQANFEELLNEIAIELNEIAIEKTAPSQKKIVPSTGPTSANAHYVQVGSYIQKQNAIKTQAELNRHGKSLIHLVKSQGQQFYTVKLGPFPTKKHAQKVMKNVATNGYHGLTLTAK